MKFEYFEPTSMEESVALMAKYDGKAKFIAGGTDLVVQMKKGLSDPNYLIDIGRIKELNYIHYNNEGGLNIGATTPVRILEKSELIKKNHFAISEAAGQLASIGVRNIATIGGNICNASPSADTVPSLICLGSEINIIGPNGYRKMLLEDFFKGPGLTNLQKDEMLIEIIIPKLVPKTGAVYLKYGTRGSIDLAIVGVSAKITLDSEGKCQEAKIVLGAVAPTALRAQKAEMKLKGKILNRDVIEECALMAKEEARPITDVRATAEYRKEMVEVFTRNALEIALTRAELA